ncbi:MAG: hypothetical protein ACP5T9_03910 [Thermoplasmata archaeon]
MGVFDRFMSGLEFVKSSLKFEWVFYPMLISFLFFLFFGATFILLVLSIIYLSKYAVIYFVLMLIILMILRPLYLLYLSKWVLKKIGVEVNDITVPMIFYFSMVLYSGTYFISRSENIVINEPLDQAALNAVWFYFKFFLPMGFLTTKDPSKGVQNTVNAMAKVYQEVGMSVLALRILLLFMLSVSVIIVIFLYIIYPSIPIFLTVLGITFIISFLFYYSLIIVVSSRIFVYSMNVSSSIIDDIKKAFAKLEAV